MAETDSTPTPMRDGDIETPAAGIRFEPAAPLKNAGVAFDPAEGGTLGGVDAAGSEQDAGGKAADIKQAMRDGASSVGQQVADKARLLVEDGKTRATGALDQLIQMLQDGAATADDKLGGHYGDYARNAAASVQGFTDTIRNKDADALMNDARAYVRQAPGVAIGVAAALGFAAARLVQSGLDDHRA